MNKSICIIEGCGKSFICPPNNPRKKTCCDACSYKLKLQYHKNWKKKHPNYNKNRREAEKKKQAKRVEEIRLKNMEKRNEKR